MATKVSSLKLGLQSGTSDTAYASWSFSKSHLDYYDVTWTYKAGSVWYEGSSSNSSVKSSTYSIPSNASYIKVSVKPVSTKNSKNKSYWTGTAVTKQLTVKSILEPAVPPAPSLSLDGYKLTVTEELDNSDDAQRTHGVQVRIYQDDVNWSNTNVAKPDTGAYAATLTVKKTITAGHTYSARCRAYYDYNSSTRIWSDWGSVSSTLKALPATITNVKCTADTSTSVKLTWTKDSCATSYTIEYTTKKAYFDTSSEVSETTVETNTAYVTGLEAGNVYYFRVRGTNDDDSAGGWSSIVSTAVGTTPEAPTTWSSTTTAIVGESVTLYWVHNTEDSSHQTQAEIELTIDGATSTVVYNDTIGEEEDETQYSYTLDLSDYTDGAEILWRVRTMGVTGEYSEWSIQRTINLYQTPTVALGVPEVLDVFPLSVVAYASPSNQTPMGYYVSITAMEAYETENYIGQTVRVSAGDEVYGKQLNVSDNPLDIEISAGDVTLEQGQTYLVTVTVSMDSGLTAETSVEFEVTWEAMELDPDAAVAIDMDALCAYITPYCEGESESEAALLDSSGDEILDSDGETILDSSDDTTDGTLISGVTLSVYRREFDGTFTEIATGLENTKAVAVTDPHPALDYARYRIVAVDTATGSVGYSDLPGEPVGEPSIVIQWDEDYTQFDYSDDTIDDELSDPLWAGTMLKLKGNVDTSESNTLDSSLVEYIGRKYPVSYYGTQVGSTASWSAEIPKDDKETIYQLRRLAVYAGDVYVREPSGTGYWAQVSVSMNLTHCEVTVPVSLSIKRVEGGI